MNPHELYPYRGVISISENIPLTTLVISFYLNIHMSQIPRKYAYPGWRIILHNRMTHISEKKHESLNYPVFHEHSYGKSPSEVCFPPGKSPGFSPSTRCLRRGGEPGRCWVTWPLEQMPSESSAALGDGKTTRELVLGKTTWEFIMGLYNVNNYMGK